MISEIILGICIIMLIFSLYMGIRNYFVYKERQKVHDKIFEQDGNGNYKRDHAEVVLLLKEQEEISTYNGMMWRFWKRPSSFYKEFLEKLR